MNELQLRGLFARLVQHTACVPVVLLAGCTPEPGPDTPPAASIAALPIRELPAVAPGPLCTTSTTLGPPDVTPGSPTSFLEAGVFGPACRLDRLPSCDPESITALDRRPYVRAGSACAGAPDVAACQASLTRQLRDACARSVLCTFRYVLTTSGGTTRLMTDATEVAAALAPIGSVPEAQLLAWMSGFDGFAEPMGTCPSTENWDTRPTGAGYAMTVLRTDAPPCIPPSQDRCEISVSTSGSVATIRCTELKPCLVVGRRPAGHGDGAGDVCGSTVGSYLALTAELEAAAVTAFAILEQELRAHGAPASLSALARQARHDEIRHAALTTALAARYGGTPGHREASVAPVRPLAEVAAENEVEGCVRETYAALLACWQSAHAQAPGIAAVLSGIAEDETRHAALSWQVAAWAREQLTPAQREQLHALRQGAIRALREEVAVALPAELIEHLGLPTPEQALALVDRLERELWARPGGSALSPCAT